MKQNKRQFVLLGMLAVAVFAYFRFGGDTFSSSGGGIEALPPIDASGLERRLKDISTVNPVQIDFERADSHPDRNLFQYGAAKPPPPDPAEVEARRKAAEEELIRQEAAARAQKEQQQAQPPAPVDPQPAEPENQPPQILPQAPVDPPKPPPPPFNFKFMGLMGRTGKPLGVFVEGERMVLARKGDIIDGKFRVLDIGAEWADVGYVDPELKGEKKRIQFGQ